MSAKKGCTKEIQQVRDILAGIESGWVDAFLILKKVEAEGSWKFAPGGDGGFEGFIQTNFPGKITQNLYRKAISAISIYGESLVRRVGVHSCTYLVRDEALKGRKKIVAKLEAHLKKHGVAPLPSVVREIVKEVCPAAFPEKKVSTSTAELIRENAALKSRVRVLEAEVSLLNAKLEEKKGTKKKLREVA
jgi:hypothetical protein